MQEYKTEGGYCVIIASFGIGQELEPQYTAKQLASTFMLDITVKSISSLVLQYGTNSQICVIFVPSTHNLRELSRTIVVF